MQFIYSEEKGFTLIEIMIAMLLSVISILVILQVFSLSDARKRVTSGAADAQQSASINLFQLGRIGRMGGAGLTLGDLNGVPQESKVWGCAVQASFNGAQITPPASTYPAPFELLSATTNLFPAIVYRNQSFTGSGVAGARTGDVLAVFGANGGSGQVGFDLLKVVGSQAILRNFPALGINSGDKLLMFPAFGSADNCVVTQASTISGSALTFGGAYVSSSGFGGIAKPDDARIVNLGTEPLFLMFGVNAQNQLVQYDILNTAGAATVTPLVIADNVVDFRAVLGVKASSTAPVTMVAPGSAQDTTYSKASMAANRALADQIAVVRIAVVIRSAERQVNVDPDAATSYTIFPDNALLTQTVNLTGDALKYKYQVYETTMPIRNMSYVPSI